jgi:hypothetical protein
VAYHRFYWFFRFWEEGELGQALGVEVGFYGLEIRQAFRYNSCSVPCGSELKVIFYHIIQQFLKFD